MIRICFETLGCKVNQYETQALVTLLTARGHTVVSPGEGCDAVVVNTCAVTAESGRKSRQAIRHLKQTEPEAVIAVCGCFSQVSPEEVRGLNVDLIAGSGDRHGFADALEKAVRDRTAAVLLDEPLKRKTFEPLPAGSAVGRDAELRTRAMLKIQDGCSNFCAYCIIPYARGPVRSLPIELAEAEAKRLGEEGYAEIVVTGIEIASYGKDLEGKPALGDVLRAVGEAAGQARLRLGSLEPRIITEEFVEALRALPNLCPHFHLSLQSGCDATLRRMKRRYTTDEFYAAVERLNGAFPGCGLTADLIVGFPGETEAEFEQTLGFIRRCGFSKVHIFPYSKRPGTPAASMPEQVSKAAKKDRARRAAAAAEETALIFMQSCVGTVQQVLFETGPADGGAPDGWSCGHAGNYLEVCAEGTGLRGKVAPVCIVCVKDGQLLGEILRP